MPDEPDEIAVYAGYVGLQLKLAWLRQQRYVWREGGLVHELRPDVDVSDRGEPYVRWWRYACGGKTLSSHMREREPGAMVTCLACITTGDT